MDVAKGEEEEEEEEEQRGTGGAGDKCRLELTDAEDDGDDVIKFRRTILPSSVPDVLDAAAADVGGPVAREKVVSKVARARKMLHKSIKTGTHIWFDEGGAGLPGEAMVVPPPVSEDDDCGGIDITEAQRALKESDKLDRLRERNRIRAKHQELRVKRRQLEGHPGDEGGGAAVLAVPSDGDEASSGEEVEEDQSDHEEVEEDQSDHEEVDNGRSQLSEPTAIEDDEELALHLLQS